MHDAFTPEQEARVRELIREAALPRHYPTGPNLVAGAIASDPELIKRVVWVTVGQAK